MNKVVKDYAKIVECNKSFTLNEILSLVELMDENEEDDDALEYTYLFYEKKHENL
jgi:hypothetical protein